MYSVLVCRVSVASVDITIGRVVSLSGHSVFIGMAEQIHIFIVLDVSDSDMYTSVVYDKTGLLGKFWTIIVQFG